MPGGRSLLTRRRFESQLPAHIKGGRCSDSVRKKSVQTIRLRARGLRGVQFLLQRPPFATGLPTSHVQETIEDIVPRYEAAMRGSSLALDHALPMEDLIKELASFPRPTLQALRHHRFQRTCRAACYATWRTVTAVVDFDHDYKTDSATSIHLVVMKTLWRRTSL